MTGLSDAGGDMASLGDVREAIDGLGHVGGDMDG